MLKLLDSLFSNPSQYTLFGLQTLHKSYFKCSSEESREDCIFPKGFGNSNCENLRGKQSVSFVCNNVTRRLCWFTRIRTIKEFRSNWIETLYYCQLIWPQWRTWLQRRCQQERLMGNRPFAACHSPDTKSPCWDANVALGQTKIMYAFGWYQAPVRLLRPSRAVLYHVNGKL